MTLETLFPMIKKENEERIEKELTFLKSLLSVMERDER
jgi:hypothetical protein